MNLVQLLFPGSRQQRDRQIAAAIASATPGQVVICGHYPNSYARSASVTQRDLIMDVEIQGRRVGVVNDSDSVLVVSFGGGPLVLRLVSFLTHEVTLEFSFPSQPEAIYVAEYWPRRAGFPAGKDDGSYLCSVIVGDERLVLGSGELA